MASHYEMDILPMLLETTPNERGLTAQEEQDVLIISTKEIWLNFKNIF